jgi:hypothetical protein
LFPFVDSFKVSASQVGLRDKRVRVGIASNCEYLFRCCLVVGKTLAKEREKEKEKNCLCFDIIWYLEMYTSSSNGLC